MTEKNYWWFSVLQGCVIPIVIAVCGYFIQDAIKQKEINARFIELSVRILSEKPSKEKVPIRAWAVDIINKFSEIKFHEKAKNLLIYNSHFAFSAQNWKDDAEWDYNAVWGPPQFIETPLKKE